VYKLLRTRTLATLVLLTTNASLCNGAEAAVTVIPSDATFASWVFAGPESQMPLKPDQYFVSINPSRSKSGRIIVPDSVENAVLELTKAIPPWVLNVLGRSGGDFECTVNVSREQGNSLDYYVFLEDWYWINWNLQDETSPLRRDFIRRHMTDRFIILQALRASICKYSKTRDMTQALQTLNSYGSAH
jgi:hypothetical protein